MLTGNNGILQRVAEAKEKNNDAQILEELQLAINGLGVEYWGNISTRSRSTFRDYIFSTNGQIDINKELDENASFDSNSYKITYKGKVYMEDEDGMISEYKPVPITGIIINRTTATTEVGEIIVLSATVEPSNTTESVKWISENENIATVNEKTGKVTILPTATVGATVVIKATNQNETFNSETNSCIITVESAAERISGIDDYIYYNVSYIDMETNYAFKPGNGWRLLTQLTEEQKEAGTYTGDIKIISTGIPAVLALDREDNVGKEINGWWGTADDVREVFAGRNNIDYIANKGYVYGSGGYPNYFAAAGLNKNFELIKFKIASSAKDNYGSCININGNSTANAELYGSVFNTKEFAGMNVHNLSLEEINIARGRDNDIISTATVNGEDATKGLFYLKNLGGHGYKTTSNPWYWLASPYTNNRVSVQYVNYDGDIKKSNDAVYGWIYGVRPVVSIPNITITKNGQVWTIN